MAVGELVRGKFTWLLDNVEIVGTVVVVEDDNIAIEPSLNYQHLISYIRGNNPLLWSPSGTPGRMHCETYPLEGSSINREEPWPLEKKPEGQPFLVKSRDGSSRPLRLGDTVRLWGRWVIDHHPEYCALPEGFVPPEPSRCHARGWLRVGPTHVELHPFRWDDIRLVEPLAAGESATAVVSLAAPLYEEQYLGGGKWVANEIAGVAGKVYLQDGDDRFESNFHTQVHATVELDPPPTPDPADPLLRTAWHEDVLALGVGMNINQVRAVERRPDGGITVRVRLETRQPDGALPSINDPANNRSIFQARYELRWERAIGNAAEYVSQTVAARMEAGQTQPVVVTIRNLGSSTWSRAAAFRLGSQSPQDNTIWGLSRVEVGTDVAPGATCDFHFIVTAPSIAGRYSFSWRMLQEAVEWFGDPSPRVMIEVIPSGGRSTVPDVRELNRSAAARLVRAAGLVASFTGSTSINAYVATQNPPPDTQVDAGSTVQMFCRPGPPP